MTLWERGMQRRELLSLLGWGGILAWASPPGLAAERALPWTGRRLILVELAGGNDGLNTLIPHKDPRYAELRPTVQVPTDQRMSLQGDWAWHGALRDLDTVWQKGELALLHGLGYPQPNHSHFKSIALWENGGDGRSPGRQGWLTADLEASWAAASLDAHGISLDGGLGVFNSPGGLWLSMSSATQFNQNTALPASAVSEVSAPLLRTVLQRQASLEQAMRQVGERVGRLGRRDFRLQGELAGQMGHVLSLVAASAQVPVLKVKLGGFDTHEDQLGRHRNLMQQLGQGLSGLARGLRDLGQWDQTLVMTYSEFGRRAAENQTRGTDHGTAAPHFVMGGRVKGGLWGQAPDLGALVEGDLVHTLDYRSLYAAVLGDWFGLPEHRFTAWRSAVLQGLIQA